MRETNYFRNDNYSEITSDLSKILFSKFGDNRAMFCPSQTRLALSDNKTACTK